ncbi:MAG: M48 family metallopeptidase [Bacteroidota bacterium]
MLKASFFDGISSQQREVVIVFKGDTLSFEYVDIFGTSIHLHWKNGEIIHEKHSHGTHRKISFKSNELVFLELYDQDFSELDAWLKDQEVDNRKYALFMSRGLLVTFLVLILGFFPLLYFVGLPLMADYASENMPVEYEQKMGNQMSASLLASMDEVKVKSTYADSFVSCFPDKFRIPVKIHVVKSDILNAYALPGGHIFVNTRILEACKTKEEFAALLGHEIGHVQLRHSTKAIMRSVIGNILLSVILSDFNAMAGVAAEQANKLKDLSYSRGVERSADAYSSELLRRSQLDLRGLADLFVLFEKEEKETPVSVPEFLSTHPLTKERIRTARRNATLNLGNIRPNPLMENYFRKLKSEQTKFLPGVGTYKTF